MKQSWLLLGVAVLFVGCESRESAGTADAVAKDVADSVYVNGKIYTVDDGETWAEAIAVRDGRIAAVGTDTEVRALAGETTKVTDLGGKMLMPGIHDTHVHPVDAGIQKTLECSFRSYDLDEVLAIVQDCIAATPMGEWVRGGQWNEGLFSSGKMPKAILDEISPEHPVFFMDWSVHNAWVNSKGLELLGIDADTPDPSGGVIVRDDSGEATGILLDNAAYSARWLMPRYSNEQTAAALAYSLDEIKSYGVTTIRDAIVTRQEMEAYDTLRRSDKLPLRVKTSLSWKSTWAESHEDEQALIAERAKYRDPLIDTEFAKIMLDGIPPTLTAALIEPYEPNDQFPADYRGHLMIPADVLKDDVTGLDAQGLTVKIHATGDGSARAALDSFEAARKANGDSGLIHEVSHAEMIHPDDMPRFKELNVAAEMCPIIWYPIPGLDWETWIGDRVPVWPVKSLLAHGALVTYGSDWPVVPTANPWPGIEAMVTRSDPADPSSGPDYPEEAIDLASAVRIFTRNSAVANKMGESSGTISVGKDADFIVLDRNIFEVPIESVGETEILLSVVAGQAIHGDL